MACCVFERATFTCCYPFGSWFLQKEFPARDPQRQGATMKMSAGGNRAKKKDLGAIASRHLLADGSIARRSVSG